MRVMIHTVPPWAPSGYGVQARLLGRGLADAGHDVAFSCYGGFIREEPFEGIPVLACGGTSKGVGRIAHNYRRAGADVMITLCDLWPLDAREFQGLSVISWLPVDCEPLGWPDQIQLAAAARLCASFRVVAMSQHGRRMTEDKGYPVAAVIPHMADPVYRTGDRWKWRDENHIPRDAFLVGSVGVNGDYPCRKGFPELLAAFQPFSERHPDARLYLHTVASPGTEGVDLYEIIKSLGLSRRVGFPDQLERLADQHTAEWMASMYRGLDVLAMPSLGEGFSVPCIEAAACGTPLIATTHSAIGERSPRWPVASQPQRAKLHNAWWGVPLVASLAEALEDAYRELRQPAVEGGPSLIRRAAKLSAQKYRPEAVIPQWTALLESIGRLPYRR